MLMLLHESLKDITASPSRPNASESILMKWIMRLMRLGAASAVLLALEPDIDPELSASMTTRTVLPAPAAAAQAQALSAASVYMGP